MGVQVDSFSVPCHGDELDAEDDRRLILEAILAEFVKNPSQVVVRAAAVPDDTAGARPLADSISDGFTERGVHDRILLQVTVLTHPLSDHRVSDQTRDVERKIVEDSIVRVAEQRRSAAVRLRERQQRDAEDMRKRMESYVDR